MTKKRIKNIYLLFLYFAFTILLLLAVIILPFIGKIYPNIYVSGIYLGDKSKTEALSYFKEKYKIAEKFQIEIEGKSSLILTNEIITDINFEKTIERAYNYGQGLNKINLIFKPVNLYPIVSVDESKLLETLLILSESVGTKPEFPKATKIGNSIMVNPGKNGVNIDLETAKQDILNSLLSDKNYKIKIKLTETKVSLTEIEASKFKMEAEKLLGKNITLKLDGITIVLNDGDLINFLTPRGFSDDLIKSRILEISRQLNRSPQDSVFIIENGKVAEFSPSKEGIVVNETALLNDIKNLYSEIEIPVIKTSPKIKNKDINDLGINTLLGKGNSNFSGSIPNRIHNVNLAQSKFKGILISPNEIVSFNNILGDVSSLTGYKSAYVIMDGKTVLGDGGGVCQVSTTLFRAVLAAGLPVIERRAHAYRVGYYEQGFAPGLDATVYSPTTDFKFKNDTGAYLLIQPTIDLSKPALTFEIYGTNDGRLSVVSKPIIVSSVTPGPDLYVDDATLPLGTIKQIEHRAYGAKVIFDYKVTRNGEELINQKFVSNYRPWQAVYLKGTKQ